MAEEYQRSRVARDAAEKALVSVVYHYGSKPELVVLGGLVPELLCSTSPFRHAGTTDIDVQANLESPQAYAEQVLIEHPDQDQATLMADAVLAVSLFHRLVSA